jgi:hypothetical protein
MHAGEDFQVVVATTEFRDSVEFAAGCGLVEADASGGDVGFEIVFAFDRGAGQAAEHGDLADVREGVGDGALQEAFDGSVEWLGRGQVIVEPFQGGEEAFDFGVPGEWCGVVPGLLPLGDGKRPVKEITQVREDLRGGARFVADGETGEMLGSATQGFGAAIGDGGYGVAEELAGGVGRCGHAVIPFSIRIAE